MQIRFRQSGGVAGLDREIAIDGRELIVRDKGNVRLKKRISQSEVRQVVQAARRLQKRLPKRFYGRTAPSDAMTTSISISQDSGLADIEVITDPADPPPPEFRSLADRLRRLTVAGVSYHQKVV